MAILITADAIRGKSTEDILGGFLEQAERGAAAAAPNFGSHVLLCLSEAHVRAEIGAMIEAAETLTTIAAGASGTPTSAPAASSR